MDCYVNRSSWNNNGDKFNQFEAVGETIDDMPLLCRVVTMSGA